MGASSAYRPVHRPESSVRIASVSSGQASTAQGPGDDGWIFFIVEVGGKPSDYHDQLGCGRGPDGTTGCCRVPHPVQIGLEPRSGPARRQPDRS
jgi:hypothetical protein